MDKPKWIKDISKSIHNARLKNPNPHKPKPQIYNKKLVQSGHVLEVYYYEKPVYVDPDMKREGRRGEADEEGKALNRQRVSYRARAMIRRLINANFTNRSKFVTLTFRDNITDLDKAHDEFDKFIKRLKRVYGDFKYIVVVEFQERGAVHYHMICSLPYIPHEVFWAYWQNRTVKKSTQYKSCKNPKLYYCIGEAKSSTNGYVRINNIEHVDNVGAYVVKYMTKENFDDRLRERKSYYTSQNLERPKEFKGKEVDAILALEGITENTEPNFVSAYESDYQGQILYEEYNPLRMKNTQKKNLESSDSKSDSE